MSNPGNSTSAKIDSSYTFCLNPNHSLPDVEVATLCIDPASTYIDKSCVNLVSDQLVSVRKTEQSSCAQGSGDLVVHDVPGEQDSIIERADDNGLTSYKSTRSESVQPNALGYDQVFATEATSSLGKRKHADTRSVSPEVIRGPEEITYTDSGRRSKVPSRGLVTITNPPVGARATFKRRKVSK